MVSEDAQLSGGPSRSFAERAGWSSSEGLPYPLGVSWVEAERAYNFALYSRRAEQVTLLFFTRDHTSEPCFTYTLDHARHRSHRIWHCRIPESELRGAEFYAYRIAGKDPDWPGKRGPFDPKKVLSDPYARALHFPAEFERRAAIRPGPNMGKAPLGVLRIDRESFDWGDDRRPRHESDLVIYEMHVRGFTQNPNSGVSDGKRGTYAGLIEKIPYLNELGVTAVELLPVFQFDPQEGNYWGYMPLSFFAPHHLYSRSSAAQEQIDEFRELVRALHAAGIEVILDAVYNHTGEGDLTGPVFNLKGIDDGAYYLRADDPKKPYLDLSGTGNAMNCSDPATRRLILDSLRYWVREMHVDGFRFDLASILARRADGSFEPGQPPIFAEIAADPILQDIRLIAEPWDAAGGYQLGAAFPGHHWLQWNDKFRDDIRRFVRGDHDTVGKLMARIYGSSDIFPERLEASYHPYQSVNYVTSHDGFTLYDLVSYNHKHNHANGLKGADGHHESHSWNHGVEGDEGATPEILKLRKRQVKNFCCLLLLSNGTPMITAGDEFLNTQGGNNNPFNQDNETTWLDWSLLEKNRDVFRFFRLMIAFRKAHPSISRSRFWRDDVKWFGVDGEVDMTYHSQSLAFYLRGATVGDRDLYVMINSFRKDLEFRIQEGAPGEWAQVIDTAQESPDDFRDEGREVVLSSMARRVASRSVVVLVRR